MTTFHVPENFAESTVSSARAAGVNTITLVNGGAFGTVFPKIALVLRGPTGSQVPVTILEVTARSGNVLTVSGPIESTSDANLIVGDVVRLAPTKLAATEIHDAIHALETVTANTVVTTGSYADPVWITSLAAAKLAGSIVATNGVVTTATYVNPSWISSLAGSKITGAVPTATALAGTLASGTLLGGNGTGIPATITVGAGLTLTGATLAATAGAGGTPGGATTQVQVNISGSFYGDSGMTYDSTAHTLTTTGQLVTNAGAGNLKTWLGGYTGDNVGFSALSFANAPNGANYAIMGTASGATFVNAATTLQFLINNNSRVSVQANVINWTGTQQFVNNAQSIFAFTLDTEGTARVAKFTSTHTTTTVLSIQAFVGQTANLTEWLASDGTTVLAAMGATGTLTLGTLGGILKATAGVVGLATAGTDYQAAGNYLTALTGDGTASGPGSAAFTLANTAVTAGSYTNSNITVDAKGRITAAANGTAGSTGANALGTYLVQTAANAPANAQVLGSLATGLLKVTTATGVITTATAGTDYLTPTGNGSLLVGLTGSQITGNIAGSAASITGSIIESQVTGLTTDLSAHTTAIAARLVAASNLSDVASAATARTNLGVGAAHRTFGVSGTPVLNATTPPIFVGRAYTCDGIDAACDTTPVTSPATVQLQTSTDGITYTSLGTAVSIAAGSYSGTQALTSAIAAGTWVRAKFTAVNGTANLSVTLYLKG